MRDPSGAVEGALLERDDELRAIADLLRDVRSGRGRALLVEGSAGLGKTTLVDLAAEQAAAAGMRVLQARADPLEQDLSWEVATQLFAPVAAGQGGDAPAAGAASLALPLLTGQPLDQGSANDPAPLLHGLHWLATDLADQQPLLLVVDDAHWCDQESLRWLVYAVRRIAASRIGVVVAARPWRATGGAPGEVLLTHLADLPGTTRRHLPQLSDDAIQALVRRELPQAAGDVVDRVVGAVVGNPLLCCELARTLREEGAAAGHPVAAEGSPAAGRWGPSAVAQAILVRLAQLGQDAIDVAVATAVLGPAASPALVAELAGVPVDRATAAVDRLVTAGLFTAGPALAFHHPLVREVVLGDQGDARARAAHLAAARALHARSAPAQDVATHLMLADPVAEPWAVEVLQAAAARHVAAGAPGTAASLLRRALDAGVAPAQRLPLLVRLGCAEAAVGDPRWLERHRAALRLLARHPAAPDLVAELGEFLYASGRYDEAVEAFRAGAAQLEPDGAAHADPVVAARLQAGRELATMLTGRRISAVDLDLAAAVDTADVLPLAQRARLAATAGHLALGVDLPGLGGVDADRPTAELVRQLAGAASRGGPLPAEVGTVVLEPMAIALMLADDLDAARRVLDEAIAQVRPTGRMRQYASLLTIRGMCQLRSGRLREAIADAGDAVRLTREFPSAAAKTICAAHHVLAVAALERDQLAEAVRAVDVPDAEERWADTPVYGWFLDAVGRVALAQERWDDARDAFGRAGERLTAAGGPGAYCDWRGGAAAALRGGGAHGEAAACAAEALRLARRFGAPRGIAVALRGVARLQGTDVAAAVALLEEAVAVLDGSPAALERAHASVELGAALRRAGQRRDARRHLREGLRAAQGCDARRLVRRAVDELEVAGARRPAMAVTGVDALTPSELRVARLAADGMGNREIAEALVVTRKTVELHLSSTYRKLQVSSRHELVDALG